MTRVIVAGSINMDLVTKVDRHPQPGETLSGSNLEYFPGGKGANQAVAAAKAGAETVMLARVGGDSFGTELTGFLDQQGVCCTSIQVSEKTSTGSALIVVDSIGENNIVVCPGANADVCADDVSDFSFQTEDVLVSQFEIPRDAILAFFECGKQAGAKTVLNTAPAKNADETLFQAVDYLILNESELGFYVGEAMAEDLSVEDLKMLALKIRTHDAQVIIVTLGHKGAVAFAGGETYQVEGHSVDVVDTTGAGDCFTGCFAAQLSAGASVADAMAYANTAASLAVQKMGAGPSMPTQGDVQAELQNAA